jgi:short-subunit dehydrogenase
MPQTHKNIVITGASSGLGYSFAKQYATKAHNLLLLGRNVNKLKLCKKECIKLGAKNVVIKAVDIKDMIAMSNALTGFDDRYPVDLIIANAGISAGTSNGGESYEQLKNIFDTNIYGVINSFFPLIERLKQRKLGQIAIISSMASFQALPSAPAYSSSKACIRFLGSSLRAELKPFNIKVNIICPGYIKTPMTEVNKFPMPFIMEADKATKYIKKQLANNNPLIIFPKILYFSMKLINLLPIWLTDYLLLKLPKK